MVGLLSDCSLNGKRAHGSACDGGKSDEAEGHDRTSLLLPGTQNTLIAEVYNAPYVQPPIDWSHPKESKSSKNRRFSSNDHEKSIIFIQIET